VIMVLHPKGTWYPSSSMASKRTKHSWLSPIVVACCKSKKSTNHAKYGTFPLLKKD
jgi:hypothetical protein